MKSRRTLLIVIGAALLLTAAALATVASAGTSRPAAAAPATPATGKVAQAPAQPPASVFSIPTKPDQARRDPFFPSSARMWAMVASAPATDPGTSPAAPSEQAVFVVRGVSVRSELRTAIINDRTLAEGEETEVPVKNGRVRIRCIQVTPTLVVIEVGGARRELPFKPN